MDLIYLILVICLIGFAVYWLTTNIKMLEGWKQMIQVVAFIIIALYLLQRFVNLPNVLPR